MGSVQWPASFPHSHSRTGDERLESASSNYLMSSSAGDHCHPRQFWARSPPCWTSGFGGLWPLTVWPPASRLLTDGRSLQGAWFQYLRGTEGFYLIIQHTNILFSCRQLNKYLYSTARKKSLLGRLETHYNGESHGSNCFQSFWLSFYIAQEVLGMYICIHSHSA